MLAVWIGPFLRMGAQYLVWKGATALCGLFAPKRLTGVVSDFSTAMGLLLAMLGTVCLFWLVSTVCFLKGVGRMMEALRQYVTVLTAAAILCAILTGLLGKKGLSAGIMRLLCGLVMVLCVFRFDWSGKWSDFLDVTDTIRREGELAAASGELESRERHRRKHKGPDGSIYLGQSGGAGGQRSGRGQRECGPAAGRGRSYRECVPLCEKQAVGAFGDSAGHCKGGARMEKLTKKLPKLLEKYKYALLIVLLGLCLLAIPEKKTTSAPAATESPTRFGHHPGGIGGHPGHHPGCREGPGDADGGGGAADRLSNR